MKPRVAMVWALTALLLAGAFFVRTVRSIWPEWRPKIEIHQHQAAPEPAPKPVDKVAIAVEERAKAPPRVEKRRPEPRDWPEKLPDVTNPQPVEIDTRPAESLAERDRKARENMLRENRLALVGVLEKQRPELEFNARKKGAEGRQAKTTLAALDRTIDGLRNGKKPAKVAPLDLNQSSGFGWLDTKEAGSGVIGFEILSVGQTEIRAKPVFSGSPETGRYAGPALTIRGIKTAILKEGRALELRGMYQLTEEFDRGRVEMVRILEPCDPWGER